MSDSTVTTYEPLDEETKARCTYLRSKILELCPDVVLMSVEEAEECCWLYRRINSCCLVLER